MITLKDETAELIRVELESLPEKFQKPFNSVHEGLGVLREEYIELENEIFFGEKKARVDMDDSTFVFKIAQEKDFHGDDYDLWRMRIKKEAVQVAAMATRIIQELTEKPAPPNYEL